MDPQEINPEIEGELSWVTQNKIVLCQTIMVVLTGRHTTVHSACACRISLLWLFGKLHYKISFNSKWGLQFLIPSATWSNFALKQQHTEYTSISNVCRKFLHLTPNSEYSYHCFKSKTGVKKEIEKKRKSDTTPKQDEMKVKRDHKKLSSMVSLYTIKMCSKKNQLIKILVKKKIPW